MIRVKGGIFQMGDSTGNADEKPVHQVILGDFMIAATETTYAAFEAFVLATGYVTDAERGEGSYIWDSLGWHIRPGVSWRHDEQGKQQANRGNYPVVHVSWQDAIRYCNWLSEQQGLTPVYDFNADTLQYNFQANGYRLPTEAEWEYAAAGGRPSRQWPFAGGGDLKMVSWYAGNAVHGAHVVAQKKANELGIFDLTGNVWEWCQDWYDSHYYAKSKGFKNPFGSNTGQERSLRGGSWSNHISHCRMANRTSRFSDFRDGSIGFRVVRRA